MLAPPIKTPMFDASGNLAMAWVKWFDSVRIALESASKAPSVIETAATGSITTASWGKTVRIDTGSTDCTYTLPAVTGSDINSWITIIRTGTGKLTLIPDSADRIDYGSYGGIMWCNEKRRAAANVTLLVVSANQWAITGATGIWRLR